MAFPVYANNLLNTITYFSSVAETFGYNTHVNFSAQTIEMDQRWKWTDPTFGLITTSFSHCCDGTKLRGSPRRRNRMCNSCGL
jgi:hypothetical protein